jgi:hypothetical protein
MTRPFPFDARSRYYYYGASRGAVAALGGAAFDPLSLSPFGFWLPEPQYLFEEEDGTGTISADEAVGYMADLSGNGRHATQATAASRPLYKTGVGLHWLEGDGTDDVLATAAFGAGLAQPSCAVTAFRNLGDLVGTNGHLASATGFSGGLYLNEGEEIRIFAGAELASGATATVGTDIVVTQVFDGASSKIAIDDGAYVTGNAGAGTMADFTLFAAGATQFTNARFYGRILLDYIPTDPEITLLRTYLAAKQGRVL